MKTLSIMALLVYWSVIILAPVIANEQSKYYDKIIYPKKKPSK
jgi:hypothetical protein|tara:strand:- start:529 stop:657 length:129 start_codon:yes stop_codon:yes gene_type:complete